MHRALVVAFAFAFGLASSGCHIGLAGVVSGTAFAPGPYRSELLASELGPGSVRTLGCLDVGFAPFERGDHELLDLYFGNRCAHPERIDLRYLVIRGVDGAGAEHDVALHDPRDEIEPLHVGASDRGRERIRLETPTGHTVVRLCFDVERIAPDAPESRAARVCFERKGGKWFALDGVRT